ncbi:MAG: hypothetical protein LPK14_04795 [Hymenobacteraceae bacterium]|nr:hypothetical protein [Hymenobacteraceae bacterium]
MKKLFRPYLAIFLIGSLVATTTACSDDDDPEPIEEQELITTVRIELVPEEGKGQPASATFRDLDGEGGNDATIETLNLAPNTVYTATLTFLDESKTPAEDITEEVEEEGDEHEIFYQVLNTITGENLQNNLTVTNRDTDSNGLPLGLQATITTTNSSSGTLRITLKHQPGGLKTSNSNITVGETDVEANFPVVIQ